MRGKSQRRAAMAWAQRLKRVFNIDIEICEACGGAVQIIACIEDPVVIEKILTHLDARSEAAEGGPDSGGGIQVVVFRRGDLPVG